MKAALMLVVVAFAGFFWLMVAMLVDAVRRRGFQPHDGLLIFGGVVSLCTLGFAVHWAALT